MFRFLFATVPAFLFLLSVGCAGAPHPSVESSSSSSGNSSGRGADAVPVPEIPTGGAAFGIEDVQLRRTNHGTLIDFRYRVVDEALASVLMDRRVPVRLVDRASGGRFKVIGSPKVGPLRNTGMPVEGRTYYVLFANPGAAIPAGAVLDLEVGDWLLEGLILE